LKREDGRMGCSRRNPGILPQRTQRSETATESVWDQTGEILDNEEWDYTKGASRNDRIMAGQNHKSGVLTADDAISADGKNSTSLMRGYSSAKITKIKTAITVESEGGNNYKVLCHPCVSEWLP
jgi:hypothetical protein